MIRSRFFSYFVLIYLMPFWAGLAVHILVIASFLMIAGCLWLQRWLLISFVGHLTPCLVSLRHKNLLWAMCYLHFWHTRDPNLVRSLLARLKFHIHWTWLVLLISLLIQSNDIRAQPVGPTVSFILLARGMILFALFTFALASWVDILHRVNALLVSIRRATPDLVWLLLLHTVVTVFVTFFLFDDFARIVRRQWWLSL